MRNISFTKTAEQIKNRTKTVTRRTGWWNLRPGEHLCAIEKGQGLKKGEHIKKICVIEVINVRWEFLYDIDKSECIKEGFPNMEPNDFVRMFCRMNRTEPDDIVNRIEFRYV